MKIKVHKPGSGPQDFDLRYYDKFYSDPASCVADINETRLHAQHLLTVFEVMEGRKPKCVVDFGAGTSLWKRALWSLGLPEYCGLDFSEHACKKFGHKHFDVRKLPFTDPVLADIHQTADIVICWDVLNYLSLPELKKVFPLLVPKQNQYIALKVVTDQDAQLLDQRSDQGIKLFPANTLYELLLENRLTRVSPFIYRRERSRNSFYLEKVLL